VIELICIILLQGKFYITRHFTGGSIYEYASYDAFKSDSEPQQYNLNDLFYGTGGVVYKGAFYYHR